MNKDLHDIDDLFRNSINGHAKEVPADVWKNIDHRLDKRQAAFYKRKYFAIRAAAILFVLVGGIAMAAILHFNQQEKTPSKESVHQDAITSTGVKSEPVKNPVRSQPSEERAMETADKQNTFPSNEHAGNDDPSHSTTNSAKNQTLEGLKSTDVQKNKEIALALPANKAHLKKAASDKSANKSMIEVATQSNTIQERAVNKQVVAGASSTRVVKDFSRTQYASIDPPAITTVDFAASLPVADLKSSVLSLPASTSSLSTAKKSKQKGSFGNWSLAPTYSQNINLNTLKDDDHFRDPRNNSREAKRTEQETISFTAGIGIRKQISSNISLETGGHYFSSQTTIEPKTIFAKPDNRGAISYQFHCSAGSSFIVAKAGAPPAVGDSIKTNFSKTSLSYLQVPLMVSYNIRFGKFSFLPSAGFLTNFLLKGKLTSSLARPTGDEEVSGSIDGLKNIYFSGTIQPQINYQFNERISFDLNPNLNFSLSPINKENAVKTYQNMIGLGAGIRLKLQ